MKKISLGLLTLCLWGCRETKVNIDIKLTETASGDVSSPSTEPNEPGFEPSIEPSNEPEPGEPTGDPNGEPTGDPNGNEPTGDPNGNEPTGDPNGGGGGGGGGGNYSQNVCDWYFACETGTSDVGQWGSDEPTCRDLVDSGSYTTDEETWLDCVQAAMPMNGVMGMSDSDIAATAECTDVAACGAAPF